MAQLLSYETAEKATVRRRDGSLAWNQMADDEWGFRWLHCNTIPPFLAFFTWFRFWRRHARVSWRIANLLHDYMEKVSEKKDWRLVSEQMIEVLESMTHDFRRMTNWHLGVPEGTDSIRPFGAKAPYAQAAPIFARAFAEMVKCVVVARVRLSESESDEEIRRKESSRLGQALSPEASAKRVEEWQRMLKEEEEKQKAARVAARMATK